MSSVLSSPLKAASIAQGESAEQLRRLYDLSTAVTRATDLSSIYDSALEALTALLSTERASILLFDPDGVMRFKAWKGLSDEYRKTVEGHSPWTADTTDAEPITVGDYRNDADLTPYAETFKSENITALGFIPLIYERRLLGKFMIYYADPHDFTESEVRLAVTVANHVSYAIGKRQSEDRLALYRQIFENCTDGIGIIALDGKYVEQNEVHRTMLGYSAEELNGASPAIHLGEAKFNEIAAALAKDGIFRGEAVSTSKGGYERPIELSAFTVTDGDSRPMYFVGIKRDITERKRAEEELRNLNHALEERVKERTHELEFANGELEAFAYSIAHDMRQYLRSIVFESRAMLEDEMEGLPADTRSALTSLSLNARQASELVNGLLEFTRLGRGQLERFPVDLSALAHTAATEVCHGFSGEPQIDIQPGLQAEGDHRLLQIVLHNLFENACKYQLGGQMAKISFTEKDGVFAVADNGIGLDMAYADEIFKPFHRLHSSSQYPGTGIGLANVKRIIERHGGDIWVKSAVGEGSTFFFTLASSG